MDYLVFLQAILYFCICISGFMVSIPVAVNRSNVGGVCILYADVKYGYILQTNESICDFAIYFGVVGMIILGLLAGALFLYFAIRSREDRNVGKGLWTIPFLPVNAAVAFVTLVAACVLTVGFQMFCSSMNKRYSCDCCEDSKEWTINSGSELRYYVEMSSLSQAAAWIGFLLCLVQTGISVLRFYRNRQQPK